MKMTTSKVRSSSTISLTAVAILMGTMLASQAQTTLISSTVRNGSFESPVLSGTGAKQNYGTGGPATDWGLTGSTYVDSGIQQTPAYASDGIQYSYLRNLDDGIYNLTTYAMQAGDQFTLTWDAKSTNPSYTQQQTVTLFGSTDGTYATAYTLVTSPDTALSPSSQSGAYQHFTLTYTATPGDVGNTIGVTFNNTTPGTTAYWSSFDNVVLTVPEPSTYALVLAGMAMLFGVCRFRSRSA